jgi:23S rRNA (cytidine1920-2'-O)/16S rRNA (cytidine1409-2'-O)-methyltransferase
MRADQRLVELGLASSRARAQAEIRSGSVTCNGRLVDRPSRDVAPDARLELRAGGHPWVSRGALKLAHALDHFAIEVEGKIALDLGASTGGFTEVLLARSAQRVYAIDVGHDQLHKKLRGDARIILREGVNARDLGPSIVSELVDLIVADLSFISLKLALPPALALAAPGAHLVALIKPQFEAGPGATKKGGVRDEAVHARVCADISVWMSSQAGWRVMGVTPSPILGGEGNREFLLMAQLDG